MKVEISVVPPGGGENDYTMLVELPQVPTTGDYLLLRSPEDSPGERLHIVRRAWWYLEPLDDQGDKRLAAVVVEAELAGGSRSSEPHKRHLAMYEARGKVPRVLDDSTY